MSNLLSKSHKTFLKDVNTLLATIDTRNFQKEAYIPAKIERALAGNIVTFTASNLFYSVFTTRGKTPLGLAVGK